METEQRFATFFPNASKGRKIGAVLSWLAAVLLMIALFIPGFCLNTGADKVVDWSNSILALAGTSVTDEIREQLKDNDVPESILPIADILGGEDASVFSYLIKYDKAVAGILELAALEEERQTTDLEILVPEMNTSGVLGIVLLAILILFIVLAVVFAFYTMNILSFLMAALAIAEIILVYLLRFKSQMIEITAEAENMSVSMHAALMVFLVLVAIVQTAGVVVHYAVREWVDVDGEDPGDIGRTMETGLIEDGTTNADANPAAILVQLNTGMEFKIYNNTDMILGKGSQANIIISNPVISRVHAKITCRNYTCTLEDLNSKNGTFLNDKKLPPKMPSRLNSGDYITLGNEMFGYKE